MAAPDLRRIAHDALARSPTPWLRHQQAGEDLADRADFEEGFRAGLARDFDRFERAPGVRAAAHGHFVHVLSRGYPVRRGPDGRVVRDSADVQPGDRLVTRLAHGEIVSRVEETTDGT